MKNLIKKVEKIANEKYSGHYTILKFTTHYKVSFGTVIEMDEIDVLTPYNSLKEALLNLILNELDV